MREENLLLSLENGKILVELKWINIIPHSEFIMGDYF
jgi:hypothetical protein